MSAADHGVVGLAAPPCAARPGLSRSGGGQVVGDVAGEQQLLARAVAAAAPGPARPTSRPARSRTGWVSSCSAGVWTERRRVGLLAVGPGGSVVGVRLGGPHPATRPGPLQRRLGAAVGEVEDVGLRRGEGLGGSAQQPGLEVAQPLRDLVHRGGGEHEQAEDHEQQQQRGGHVRRTPPRPGAPRRSSRASRRRRAWPWRRPRAAGCRGRPAAGRGCRAAPPSSRSPAARPGRCGPGAAAPARPSRAAATAPPRPASRSPRRRPRRPHRRPGPAAPTR